MKIQWQPHIQKSRRLLVNIVQSGSATIRGQARIGHLLSVKYAVWMLPSVKKNQNQYKLANTLIIM